MRRIGKKQGEICCRRCNRKIGELEWLKRRNTTYFINHPTFFDQNETEINNKYFSFQENLVMGNLVSPSSVIDTRLSLSLLGDVKCHCGNSLGGYQKFTDRSELGSLCALKCKQIKFRVDNQQPYVEFQQWSKNNRFDIEELEEI